MDYARNTAAKVAQDLPINVEEAIAVGYLGMVEAAQRFDIEKFDPTRGDIDNNFRSFVYSRIVGSVIDKVRNDAFVKRRGVQKGIKFEMLSFDMQDPQMTEPVIQIEALAGDPDLGIDFERAIKTLSDRERHIVMSLAVGAKGHELADELGVSASRISQIATTARHKLSTAMGLETEESS